MKYRVIEDLTAPPEQRYAVQSTIYGHTWQAFAWFADSLSAEIYMERLVAPPRVIAEARDP
jgi:hypothetical protein